MVNKKMNPITHIKVGEGDKGVPWSVLNHLKTFTPVGIAIIIVADVK